MTSNLDREGGVPSELSASQADEKTSHKKIERPQREESYDLERKETMSKNEEIPARRPRIGETAGDGSVARSTSRRRRVRISEIDRNRPEQYNEERARTGFRDGSGDRPRTSFQRRDAIGRDSNWSDGRDRLEYSDHLRLERQGGASDRPQRNYEEGYERRRMSRQERYADSSQNQSYRDRGYSDRVYSSQDYQQDRRDNYRGRDNRFNSRDRYPNRQDKYSDHEGGGSGSNRFGSQQRRNNDRRPNGRGSYNNRNKRGGKYQKPYQRVFTPRPKPVEYSTDHIDENEPMRLNKYMANSGACSRREADNLIQQGRVTVNGEVVTELGTKILITDEVTLNGKKLELEKKVYVLLNKPKNCVTTSDDPQERLTVLDLVKNACEERIYPVGRLDRNTTGVLLLTNDGDLATKLMHPALEKKKIYQVWLNKPVTVEDMQQIADGIQLDDGEIHADAISYVSPDDLSQVGIEIHSGRNRIVRRIFEHLGYKVYRLDRVYFAGLTKKNLPRGKWRYLTQEEVNMLRMGAFE